MLTRDGAPAPLVVTDARRAGVVAAELVVNRLAARPRARLLMSAGRPPASVYAALRAHARAGDLAASRPTVLQLDEYVGVGPGDPRSVAASLRRELDRVPLGALVALDGAAPDPVAEAARHEAAVEAEAVDVALLGLGRDGHVAFDEPPARRASGVRIVELAPDSREEAAALDPALAAPARALTVGLGTLYRARELILLACGEEVAPALHSMLEHPIGPGSPASLLRDHPRLTIVCDRAAAGRLAPRAASDSDRVLIVLGHREPGISAEHRISAESRARLRRALAIATATPVRAVVLTGYTATGGLSEAEQMKTAWDEAVAPTLLEVAGRDTAENATRSLPIVLALGDARRVTVVSSAWHVRVPWFFAPYRRFGLRLSYRASFRHGSWIRMLREELRKLPAARRERRAALAAMRVPPEGPLER